MVFRVILSVRTPLLLAILVTLGSSPTFASMIRLDFGGTIQTSDFGSVTVGTPLTGYLYYDTTAVPWASATSSDVAGALYVEPQIFAISLGGSQFVSDPSSPFNAGVHVIDRFASQPQPANALDSIDFSLDGFKIAGPLAAETQATSRLFLSFSGLPTVLDSIQVPLAFPALGQWTNAKFVFSPLQTEQTDSVIVGDLTSLTSSPVPEPSYILLFPVLLALGAAYRRRRRL